MILLFVLYKERATSLNTVQTDKSQMLRTSFVLGNIEELKMI